MANPVNETYNPKHIFDADPVDNLNRLIGINRDAVNGYREAAELVNSTAFALAFQGFARDRQAFASELANMVTDLHGDPDTDGDVKGMLHRAWMNLKTTVANGDEALLDEIVRGERAAVDVYNDVLETDLTPQQRTAVANQLESIREALNRIETLKQQVG